MPLAAKSLSRRLRWADLDPAHLHQLVAQARDEDLAGLGLRLRPRRTGDRSTAALALRGNINPARADLVAREPLVACGLPLATLILVAYGAAAKIQNAKSQIRKVTAAQIVCRVHDGTRVRAGGVLATIMGDPRLLLAAERVILNFLQRLSGVATHTARHVAALGPGRTRLLDTRKTTPGHRMLEKYAVACGGGWNHRLGLFDRVMLKDNHLAVLGFAADDNATRNVQPPPSSVRAQYGPTSVRNSKLETQNSTSALAAAVAAARRTAPSLAVEVEVDHLGQIPAVLAAGADVILLDNFSPAQIRRAVALIAGRARTEASGGITLKNISRYAGLGLDFVSTGALVHHSSWADIGLDWRA
jgi:nicotinate-nucleotide pyrophosphorylase (carboxylating)